MTNEASTGASTAAAYSHAASQPHPPLEQNGIPNCDGCTFSVCLCVFTGEQMRFASPSKIYSYYLYIILYIQYNIKYTHIYVSTKRAVILFQNDDLPNLWTASYQILSPTIEFLSRGPLWVPPGPSNSFVISGASCPSS